MEFSTSKLLNRCEAFPEMVVPPLHTGILYHLKERRRISRHFEVN